MKRLESLVFTSIASLDQQYWKRPCGLASDSMFLSPVIPVVLLLPEDQMTKYELFAELEELGLSPGQIVVMWPILRRFVAKWMQDWYGEDAPPMAMPEQWQREM